MVNCAKNHFQSWEVSVTKIGIPRVSNEIEILPTKYTTLKASSKDQISAVFEKIAKTLNNSKLREGFLNANKDTEILNEIIGIFNKRTKVQSPRVIKHGMDTQKIAHVPTRVGKTVCKRKNRAHKNVYKSVPIKNKRMSNRQNNKTIPTLMTNLG